MSARFPKEGAPIIANNVANIINLSIKHDTFPSQCKTVKINLCLKSVLKLKNYRLITLLPLISKVIRKIHSQSHARLPLKK